MELIVLGSGTGIPTSRRNAPGYYVFIEPFEMLLDWGSGVLRQLAHAGRSYADLDAVWLSHLHPDHIGDLLPLVHALKFPDLPREKPLTLFGPTGLKGYFQRHIEAVTGLPIRFEIRVREVHDTIHLHAISVRSIPTKHTDHSRAYRIEANGRALVYTGDTDVDQVLIPFCEQADLAVMDCSFPNELKVDGHLCPRECAEIARRADIQLLALSHIYPPDEPEGNRVKQCRSAFSGDVILAEDFMRFDLDADPIKVDYVGPKRDA